jgi:serine/threonine-protein kinase HipA
MAKNTNRREILVYANWVGIKEPMLMGKLYSETVRNQEIFSFEYSDIWLTSKYAQIIDPDLQLYSGAQYLDDKKNNFGIFLDSSPDRWGRRLMRRREAAYARLEKRPEKTLFESDYLLGVFDEHRMGGLRFKDNDDGLFLNDDERFASPPWTSLNELEQASLKIENDEITDDPEYLKWLNMLIAPGSSLGGARPKASVLDREGNLWIAKFPSMNDGKDVGGWEMVVHKLAVESGLNVADSMIMKFSNKYHTFLTKRFDRTKDGERIHFASAMTMLGYTDFQEGASYLELAEFLTTNGANVNKDLEELWKRIVFSICVTNTDDHLRNHGFILTDLGWILSPAYDINPVENGMGLKLNISENDNSLDFDLAMEVIEYFRLDKKKALEIINHIKSVVSSWRNIANSYSIPKSGQELMAKAFRI